MIAKITRLTHKIAIQLQLVRELYQLHFSLQAASPETFEYTVVFFWLSGTYLHIYKLFKFSRASVCCFPSCNNSWFKSVALYM